MAFKDQKQPRLERITAFDLDNFCNCTVSNSVHVNGKEDVGVSAESEACNDVFGLYLYLCCIKYRAVNACRRSLRLEERTKTIRQSFRTRVRAADDCSVNMTGTIAKFTNGPSISEPCQNHHIQSFFEASCKEVG